MRGTSAVIRVVKLGGRVQADSRLPDALASVARGLVLVHGGGDDVSELQRRLGQEPRFVGGRRVTSADEVELVRMVLSGQANKRLVVLLARAGARAVGVSGEDGGLLRAHVAPGAPLGRVGENVVADPALIRDLLSHDWLPVVSPLARDADEAEDAPLNVNGDDAAAALAEALGADELLFLADVPGVLIEGERVDTLSVADAENLISTNIAVGGMAAKLQAACAALTHGVGRVRIGDLRALHDRSAGTTILPNALSWRQ